MSDLVFSYMSADFPPPPSIPHLAFLLRHFSGASGFARVPCRQQIVDAIAYVFVCVSVRVRVCACVRVYVHIT
jgi:hypothetical protein